MEPRIVSQEGFAVVGMLVRGRHDQGEIPRMWQALGPRVPEIQHRVAEDVAYGLSDNMDCDTGEFDYVTGFKVTSAASVPPGMVAREVPGGRYAVFTTTLPGLGETFKYAYDEWLPSSGYQHRPAADLEIYGESFDPQDPDSTFDVYVPIE